MHHILLIYIQLTKGVLMMRRSQRKKLLLFVIILIFFLSVWGCSRIRYFYSPGYQTSKVVEAFYTFEQDGDFGDSWELLHPLMKEKWTKTDYMRDRIHVFVGHFGTETFEFAVVKDIEIKDWSMAEEIQPLDIVYKYNVTQTYRGKYGKFSFSQEVYVAKDGDDWRILWDYNF